MRVFATKTKLAGTCAASALIVLLALPIAANAQEASTPQIPTGAAEVATAQPDVIIVVATRRGTARGGLAPTEVVDETQLEVARGLTIGEVLERLKRDGGYNTQILVNGRPAEASISVQGLPSEAITRIEILPPQTAASYGERVDGEVINVVLKNQFRSVQIGGSVTTTANTDGLDLGANVQRTVLEGEAQDSLGFNASNVAARLSKPQTDGDMANLISAGIYNFDVNFQRQRPIKDGLFFSYGGNLGAGESDFSAGLASQSDVSLIAATKGRWGLTSSLNANEPAYFYSLTAAINVEDDDQRSVLERNRKSASNAQVTGSINGVIVKVQDVPITAGLTASWRGDKVRNIQSLDGLETVLKTNADQSDFRGSLAAPWNNGKGQDVGALSVTLGLEAMLTDGVGGNSTNINVGWVPLPRLSLSLNGIFSSMQIPQVPLGKPLVGRERVFDIVTRTERDVTVLRDDIANVMPVDSQQVDFNANYSLQTKWPIDLSLQASRSSNSGQFDRPDGTSPELQLQQPSRYLRGGDGTLTTIDLRTRQLAQQTRNTVTLNIGVRIPLGQKSEEAEIDPSAQSTRAADAIAAADGEINISLNSQWQIVPRRGVLDDVGLGEATNRTGFRASWTQGAKSLTINIDRVGPTLSRDIDGSLFTVAGWVIGSVQYSMPLEFMRHGRTYFKNTQLQVSLGNIMLSDNPKLSNASAQNRFSMAEQQGFTASLALSRSF